MGVHDKSNAILIAFFQTLQQRALVALRGSKPAPCTVFQVLNQKLQQPVIVEYIGYNLKPKGGNLYITLHNLEYSLHVQQVLESLNLTPDTKPPTRKPKAQNWPRAICCQGAGSAGAGA